MTLFPKIGASAGTGQRPVGFARWCDLLSRYFKHLFVTNLLTIAGFLPFTVGVVYAILSSSILVLIPACIIGGAIAGPALACMYDAVYRSLREAPGKCMANYRKALKQNWRHAIIPGIIFCLFIGFYIFMLMMFWWTSKGPGFGTIAVCIFSIIVFTMFFSIYWPQYVLFDQPQLQRCRNCLLFMIRYFLKTLGCSVLQVVYWGIMALFLPWTLLLVPLIGFWFILFVSNFLIYDTMNDVFEIEDKIAQAFPDQAVIYEDDEAWLKRKQEEDHETHR